MEVMEINSNQEAEALADGEEESPTDPALRCSMEELLTSLC